MYFWTITCRMFLFFSIVAWQSMLPSFFMPKSRILVSLIEMKVTKILYNFHKITMVSLVTRTLLIKARAMAFCCS